MPGGRAGIWRRGCDSPNLSKRCTRKLATPQRRALLPTWRHSQSGKRKRMAQLQWHLRSALIIPEQFAAREPAHIESQLHPRNLRQSKFCRELSCDSFINLPKPMPSLASSNFSARQTRSFSPMTCEARRRSSAAQGLVPDCTLPFASIAKHHPIDDNCAARAKPTRTLGQPLFCEVLQGSLNCDFLRLTTGGRYLYFVFASLSSARP